MKISDFKCRTCGSCYLMAESSTGRGRPGLEKCSVCGDIMAEWKEPKLKAFKLVVASTVRYAAARSDTLPRSF
jgi:uncharacterized Zn finger protein